VIGNLIYYRYINSAICSPSAYDIVDVQAGSSLDLEQQKNLACIAKHLQLISMNKGVRQTRRNHHVLLLSIKLKIFFFEYGDMENSHLACLNSFIKECHDRMRAYFHDICLVPDADEHFGIDEFSDLVVLTKPVVYLSAQEIHDTHKVRCFDKIGI
jgi:hypothetical protein